MEIKSKGNKKSAHRVLVVMHVFQQQEHQLKRAVCC